MNHFCLKFMLFASLLLSACGQAQLPLGDETREKCKSLEQIPIFPAPDQLSDLEQVRVKYNFSVENLDGSPLTEVLYLKSASGDIERIALKPDGTSPESGKVLFAPRDSQLCRATINETPLREEISTTMNFEVLLTDQDGEYELLQLQRAQDEADYVMRLFGQNIGTTLPPMNYLVIHMDSVEPIPIGFIQESGNRIVMNVEASPAGHMLRLGNLKPMNINRLEIPHGFDRIALFFAPQGSESEDVEGP